MVNISTVASLASLALAANERNERQELQEQYNQHISENGENATPDMSVEQQQHEGMNERLDKLVEIEQSNRPTPADKDAYASAVLELGNGEAAEVVIEPASGWNLRVKEVYMDRAEDHTYEINVGGDVTSVSHRSKYAKPRTVTQSDRVVATVVNESGSASVIDFEVEAWAERPASDGVK